MAVDKEKIEKVLSQLPVELQQEVLEFAESLVRKTGTSANGTSSARTMFGVWNSGDPHSADNDRIGADIARLPVNAGRVVRWSAVDGDC